MFEEAQEEPFHPTNRWKKEYEQIVKRIRQRRQVFEVLEQRRLLTTQTLPFIGHTDFVNDSRFAGIDGTGTAVVVIDSGANLNHQYFGPDGDSDGVSDRIIHQQDFVDVATDASDDSGHGSNIATIIRSEDSVNGGIAPGVDIIVLDVTSDGEGGFATADLEAALQWVVANGDALNVTAVNLSLAYDEFRCSVDVLRGPECGWNHE